MRICELIILSALAAGQLFAQSPTSLELSAQASYWRLDQGSTNGSTTRWGPTLSATIRPSGSELLSMRIIASYAPEAEGAPGLAAVAGDLVVAPWRSRSGQVAPYLSAGIGGIHFAASRIEQSMAACRADPECMFEGVGYRSGWRGMLHGGIGAQIGLSGHVFVAPEVQIMRRLGSDDAGPVGERTWLRLGIGLGWR